MTIDPLSSAIHAPLGAVVEQEGELISPCSSTDVTALLRGAPRLVADQTFGSALAFSLTLGADDTVWPPDHLELRGVAFQSEFNFSAWVRVDPKSGSDSRALLALRGNDLALAVRVQSDGNEATVEIEANHQWLQGGIAAGEWVHLLVTVNDTEVILRINGGKPKIVTLLAPCSLAEATKLTIGADPGEPGTYPYAGHLAHLRLYPRLAKSDHALVWSLDRAPTENFRAYSPLEFDLYDENQKPVIYVEGGEIAHRLTLALWNRDEKGQAISLHTPNATALDTLGELKEVSARPELLTLNSAGRDAAANLHRKNLHDFFRENHHVEVRFPAAILSVKTVAWAESQLLRLLARDASFDADAWYICCLHDPLDNSDVIYMLSASERPDLKPQDGASVGPDLLIVMPHLAARLDADGEVLPVEIRSGPLTRRSGDLARLGPRVRQIEVMSQLGKRFIPLHFAVVGADQVINDGETETFLLLRLTNIDREETIAIDRVGNLRTVFTLSCELSQPGVEREWALSDGPAKVRLWVKEAQPQNTRPPDPDDRNDWPGDPLFAHSDGVRMTWEFDGHHIATSKLEPDHSVYMCLAVTTDLRTGPSDLVLSYRHIPNYWDGGRRCKINKSPLIYDRSDATRENRVGIGTPHPANKLAVSGGVNIGRNYADANKVRPGSWPPTNGMLVEGSVGIGTQDLAAKLHVNEGSIRISETTESATMELVNDQNTNLIFTEGGTGHLHLRTDSDSYHVLLQEGGTQGGNVGIGTIPDKAYKLEVDGRIKGTLHGEDLIDNSVSLGELAHAVQNALCPPGTILAYAGDTAPTGWGMCNRDDYGYDPDSAQYSRLFGVIGYRFGGFKNKKNGPHFFMLPDLRGRFLRGRDAGAERDPDVKERGHQYKEGATGDAVGSVQGDTVVIHSHVYDRIKGRKESEYEEDASGLFVDSWHETFTSAISPSDKVSTETRPKNMYVNFIIKF